MGLPPRRPSVLITAPTPPTPTRPRPRQRKPARHTVKRAATHGTAAVDRTRRRTAHLGDGTDPDPGDFDQDVLPRACRRERTTSRADPHVPRDTTPSASCALNIALQDDSVLRATRDRVPSGAKTAPKYTRTVEPDRTLVVLERVAPPLQVLGAAVDGKMGKQMHGFSARNGEESPKHAMTQRKVAWDQYIRKAAQKQGRR